MRALAAALRAAGVADACISPGSRSTAAALALVQAGLRPWVITDERAAGFFALGLARAARRPVVLLCTSGTAAANYLPAVVEASLSQVPLVVLTADRPPELRDCAAAQTIDQVHLFGSHVRWSVDAPAPGADADLDDWFRTLAARAVAAANEAPRGPVHVNLPMREPLVDVAAERARLSAGEGSTGATWPPVRVFGASGLPSASAVTAIAKALATCRRGLIVAGPNAAQDGTAAAAVTRLASRLGWPILADPLSGLRSGDHDRSHVIDAYDVLLQGGALGAEHRPDAVLQLGAPLVSASTQRLLAAARAPVHVVVAPPGVWPDPLQRATDVVRADAGAFADAVAAAIDDGRAQRDDERARRDDERVSERDGGTAPERDWFGRWMGPGMRARDALDRALADEPALFEGTVLADLIARLPEGTSLHVGNSLPIRALDTFVGGAPGRLDVACNRGANGIDGVVASALGASAAGRGPTVLVVGDLSFLHDVGALQIAARHRLPLLVVVVNNDGGGIFSFLPQAALGDTFETLFGTPHGLSFAGAVEMCGGRYVLARRRVEVAAAIDAWRDAPAFTVIEVPSDRAETRALHARLIAAACAAMTNDAEALATRGAEAR